MRLVVGRLFVPSLGDSPGRSWPSMHCIPFANEVSLESQQQRDHLRGLAGALVSPGRVGKLRPSSGSRDLPGWEQWVTQCILLWAVSLVLYLKNL